MLIAQITDIHLGFEADNVAEFNRKRLDQVLHSLSELDVRPEMLFATGDLVDRGDVDSYRRLRSALEGCPFPVWPCMGNHDDRANFRTVFPEVPVVDGFVQYVIDTDPVRFVVLDTLEEGRHGGAYCERRAAWLADTLAQAPAKPTMIVMHHPPFETGIDWMTTHPDEPWVGRLVEAMSGHDQIFGVICGHIHRTIVTNWHRRTLAVCPSTAPQVALTLAPIDPERPDLRPLIIADAPAYALHHWNGREMVSHFDTAEPHVVIVRYDEQMGPLVRSMMQERPGC
jgi:Icc protein